MIEQEIIDICTKYNIKKYTINQDGSIDVNENVYLSYLGLTELPLKFNKVSGYFNCNENQLTSLKGCPNYVGNSFDCSKNQLTSLIGSPNYVGGSLWCYTNQLTTLDGYNGDYDKLYCYNKDKLIRKHKRKDKLKILETL